MAKSLRDDEYIKEILQFVTDNTDRILKDEQIFQIMEENIKPLVEKKLEDEIISQRALKISKERIPPINIMKLINKRLSKIYVDPPTRQTDNEGDKTLMQTYESKAHLNKDFSAANLMLNAQRRLALEPYLSKGKPKTRVLPANQFLVYSELGENQLDYDVFIKFVGSVKKSEQIINGNETSTVEKQVDVLHLFTDKEFCIIDGDGTRRQDLMEALGVKGAVDGVSAHSTGRIPFTYINTSIYKLMPVPQMDDVDFALLIACLLTDLNYAIKYQAHSMIYTINLDSGNIDMNPDSIVNFESDVEEGQNAEVGSIKPNVEIESTLKHIAAQLKIKLQEKGLKVDVNSTISSKDAQSGIQETIQNATLVEERKDQVLLFTEAEEDYFELLGIRHNKWHSLGKLKGQFNEHTFSEAFNVNTVFAEQKSAVSRSERGSMLSIEIQAGITSQETAMREIHPEWTEDQIKAELAKVKKEKEEAFNLQGGQQQVMNENNKQKAEEKKVKDSQNAKSTQQNDNPNKR